MRQVLVAVVVLLAVALSGPAAAAPPRTDSGGASPVTVELDRASLGAGPGQKIRFTSTVRNVGSRPLSGLIAHLNILSSDPKVYVDPEDWSPRRTQYLDELPPGKDVVLDWDVRAVTTGPLVLFVAVTGPKDDRVTASGPLRVRVEGRRVVNSENVLPLVMGMPAGVLVLLGLTRVRRRRLG